MINIIFAMLCIAVGFTLNKLYQKKFCHDVKDLLIFPIITSSLGWIFYFFINSFQMRFGAFTVICALGYAVTTVFNSIIGLVIMERCKMSLYMSFLMVGGMLIPFLYGVTFLSESLSVLRIIAMCVLITALFLPVIAKTGEKTSKVGIILCVCVFVSNGLVSTIAKIHQINPSALGTNDFMLWTSAFSVVLCGISFAVYFLMQKKRKTLAPRVQSSSLKTVQEKKHSKYIYQLLLLIVISSVSALGTIFNLTGAKTIDAAMLYPMLTGGSIVLTSLAGWFIYREKANVFSVISVCLSLVGTILFAL